MGIFRKDHGSKIAEEHGAKRSSAWPRIRKEHLKKEPRCAVCKKKRKGIWAKVVSIFKPVQVHHIIPFHTCVSLGRPDLELDDRNLVTLCESGENHHVLIGHLGDFQSYDKDVREHAEKQFLGMAKEKIKADPAWQKLSQERPKDLDKMSEFEKTALKAYMNQAFPK